MTREAATGEESYEVVLLVEQALTDVDATQVRSLHQELDDDPTIQVAYHVLFPMTDAAAAVEASLGVMGGADLMAPPPRPDAEEVARLREDFEHQAESDLEASVRVMVAAGATVASTTVVEGSAVDALIEKVAEVDGREAIILTRPHVVAEFFHVDWTSRARRKLGVPVLHLLEHETFVEQSEDRR